VDAYLDAARLPDLPGAPIAVMAPHAGHRYSGPVAGYAFATLRGLAPDLVAVISRMHYPYDRPLRTTAHRAYATPLGPIELDLEAVADLDEQLVAQLGSGLVKVANDPEHSLEIELPFLQRALAKPFRLLPVMVRDQSAPVVRALGRALARVLARRGQAGRDFILVASTDLSHFYPQPVARELDAELLRRVAAFDPHGVLDIEAEGLGFACGRGALSAMLWACDDLGADRVHVLHHATSGDVSGDYDRVVGYGAAVVTFPLAAQAR
jgi:AmmeMemoRadiSam system protein B